MSGGYGGCFTEADGVEQKKAPDLTVGSFLLTKFENFVLLCYLLNPITLIFLVVELCNCDSPHLGGAISSHNTVLTGLSEVVGSTEGLRAFNRCQASSS